MDRSEEHTATSAGILGALCRAKPQQHSLRAENASQGTGAEAEIDADEPPVSSRARHLVSETGRLESHAGPACPEWGDPLLT